jgi:1,2-phenylacetyl-CoA epoxidase catalytic subunit
MCICWVYVLKNSCNWNVTSITVIMVRILFIFCCAEYSTVASIVSKKFKEQEYHLQEGNIT